MRFSLQNFNETWLVGDHSIYMLSNVSPYLPFLDHASMQPFLKGFSKSSLSWVQEYIALIVQLFSLEHRPSQLAFSATPEASYTLHFSKELLIIM